MVGVQFHDPLSMSHWFLLGRLGLFLAPLLVLREDVIRVLAYVTRVLGTCSSAGHPLLLGLLGLLWYLLEWLLDRWWVNYLVLLRHPEACDIDVELLLTLVVFLDLFHLEQFGVLIHSSDEFLLCLVRNLGHLSQFLGHL